MGGTSTPAAIAIPAVLGAVGVGGSIFSGITGAKAAKSASQVQYEAAQQAGKQVTDAAAAVNPGILTAGATAGQGVTTAAGTAATNAGNAASSAGSNVTGQSNAANDILDPYSQAGQAAAGTLQKGLATGGDFNKNPTLADLQIDPGFAYRLAQSQIGFDRSAAARGGVLSGAAIKDSENMRQNLASQEYQNAFNRFETSTQNRFKNLSDVAGLGAATGTTQGQNLIGASKYAGDTGIQASEFGGALNTNAAQYAGDKTYGAATTTAQNTLGAAEKSADYLTQGANAKASGIVGSANAVSNAVGSGIGAVTSAGNLYNLLKYPNRPIAGKPQ